MIMKVDVGIFTYGFLAPMLI